MKSIFLIVLVFTSYFGFAQVTLDADGPGETYELITSVLAPDKNPIETPDCSHNAFGNHIDELFDDELNTNVFRFYIHVTPDDDRCINFDRQRNEIKTYDQSPDNLLGIEGEKVVYKWKFKLPTGFQSSPNFTHIHQLKSVGGQLASMPMYTLTTRKSNPDRLELRYAETDNQITLDQTDLAPLMGTWLDVTETILYGENGTYEIEIKRVDDDEVLFAYSNMDIINWREDAEFVRPKWGIYRSLINAQDLRDENVLFANFSIEELEYSLTDDAKLDQVIISNPVSNTISIKNISTWVNSVELYRMDGRKIMVVTVDSEDEINLDVSDCVSGSYVVKLIGNDFSQAKLVHVFR